MSPNKRKAPRSNGRHYPYIFDMWTRDINQFFGWDNLSNNRRVRFSRIILIDETQFY